MVMPAGSHCDRPERRHGYEEMKVEEDRQEEYRM